MWLFTIIGAVALIVVLLMVVLYAQCKEDVRRREQGLPPIKHHDITDGDTCMVYTVSHTPDASPSLYEHCKGGQRPFGDNSRTRRSERERTRTDRFYY